jgi:hypothetical protein
MRILKSGEGVAGNCDPEILNKIWFSVLRVAWKPLGKLKFTKGIQSNPQYTEPKSWLIKLYYAERVD